MDFDITKTSELARSKADVSDFSLPLSDSYFKTLFNNLLIPAVILQPCGTIYYANNSFFKFFDLEKARLIKSSLLDYITSSTQDSLIRLLDEPNLLKGAKPASLSCRFIDGNQTTVDVELSLNWIQEIEGILVLIEKKESCTENASTSQKDTEELENLFYMISHNLKSPIVSIQGFVKLLLECSDKKQSPEERHFIERIQKNASRLNEMVQDVLQFSRLSQKAPQLEIVSLIQVLNNIKVESFFRLNEKKISLKIAEDLPEVKLDSEEISIIFQNLIDNAIKYIGDTREPEIEVGWEKRPRFYVFWVGDNGPGVREKTHDLLFNMFERADSTKEIEGTGVGLAIVKGIVEKYGGHVRLTSTYGKGTKVYFTIPI